MALRALTEIGESLLKLGEDQETIVNNRKALRNGFTTFYKSLNTLRQCFKTLRDVFDDEQLFNAAKSKGIFGEDLALFDKVATKEGWKMKTSYQLGQSKEMVKKHGLRTLIQFRSSDSPEEKLRNLLRLEIIILDELHELRFFFEELSESLASINIQQVLDMKKANIFKTSANANRWLAESVATPGQAIKIIDQFIAVQGKILKSIKSNF